MTTTRNDCFHLTGTSFARFTLRRSRGLAVRMAWASRRCLNRQSQAPQATFGGQSPYADIVEIAAAYLFYICRNHPFVDGNKRTALGACIVFLRLNGIEPAPDGSDWEALTVAVAASEANREQTTARLRQVLAKSRKPKETSRR